MCDAIGRHDLAEFDAGDNDKFDADAEPPAVRSNFQRTP